MNISTTIKSIQDIMRKDDGVDGGAQRIGQLSWMLFLKIYDQCEETWEDDAADRGETYRSALPRECRLRNWAAEKDGKPQIQANELVRYVNDEVFPALKDLPVRGDARAKVVRAVFVEANNYMKSGTLMLDVIQKLDAAIDFHDIRKRGQLGEIYEQILNDLAQRRQCRRVLHPSRRHRAHGPASRPRARQARDGAGSGLRHRRLPHRHHRPPERADRRALQPGRQAPSPTASAASRRSSSRTCSVPPT